LYQLKNHPLFSNQSQASIYQEREKHQNQLPPFIGGFCGFLSYDYGVFERFNMPPPTKTYTDLPHIYGGLYDVVLYANHQTKVAGITALAMHPIETPNQRVKSIFQMARKKHDCANTDIVPLKFDDNDAQPYMQQVQQTIDYIEQGDIFQANITRPIQKKRPENFNSLQHYLKLRTINNAPFGVYMHDTAFQILSASPERFLKINNRHIIVEPIKGTIQSHADKVIDQERQDTLQNCPKNRAENIMIVDLLRNDITPHCQTGSIKVMQLCNLQSFKGLHHLISTITATMMPNAHIIDILKTALPAGSITGAPKKRVCEIIYELEKAQRGAYCGNIGYVGFDGQCDMNILIRTLQIDQKNITFNSGCGITAQSDPTLEWQETQTKIAKIIQSFSD